MKEHKDFLQTCLEDEEFKATCANHIYSSWRFGSSVACSIEELIHATIGMPLTSDQVERFKAFLLQWGMILGVDADNYLRMDDNTANECEFIHDLWGYCKDSPGHEDVYPQS